MNTNKVVQAPPQHHLVEVTQQRHDFDNFWYCSSRCPGTPGRMTGEPLTWAGEHHVTDCPSPEIRARYELVCATRGAGPQLDLFGAIA